MFPLNRNVTLITNLPWDFFKDLGLGEFYRSFFGRVASTVSIGFFTTKRQENLGVFNA